MKLFPRHYKVLNAVNGYSADLYVRQRSGVHSTEKVANELIKGGFIRRRKRAKTIYGSTGCKNALERTDKGEKALLKSWSLYRITNAS